MHLPDIYIPRGKPAGFIFIDPHQGDANKTIITVAHELGHGAFTLKHSFEEYPSLAQGSTDNLMDYNTGSVLWKKQWDKIHDPATVLGLFEDDQSGASVGTQGGVLYRNESQAYKNMWNRSFDSNGKVTHENHAWITNKGILVLPTQNNTYNLSDFNIVPTEKRNGKWYVHYGNDWLQILGSFHTHPNNWKSGMSDTDQYIFFKGPAFVLDHQNLMIGWINGEGDFKFADLMSHNLFFDTNFSIINNLSGILPTLK